MNVQIINKITNRAANGAELRKVEFACTARTTAETAGLGRAGM